MTILMADVHMLTLRMHCLRFFYVIKALALLSDTDGGNHERLILLVTYDLSAAWY